MNNALYLFMIPLLILVIFIIITRLSFVKFKKEQKHEALCILEKYKRKASLFIDDLTDFAKRNDLMEKDFYPGFPFKDCIEEISSALEPYKQMSTLEANNKLKSFDDIIDFIYEIQRNLNSIRSYSRSLETKRMLPTYNKEVSFESWMRMMSDERGMRSY